MGEFGGIVANVTDGQIVMGIMGMAGLAVGLIVVRVGIAYVLHQINDGGTFTMGALRKYSKPRRER